MTERPIAVEGAVYFPSRTRVVRTDAPGMRRRRLFVAISRDAADPVGYFGLPLERAVVMGSQIDDLRPGGPRHAASSGAVW